ncbi:hypothetical protein CCR75_002492 [Bremia lactucae]|uniref:Uncharacterized protein n=1 Tax=Bremia lactucae TaxID=4779 RepID=A0A976FS47_BRELC|nr:hypothetical protein CCR75_002492 [Bremia lactucae]
MKGEEERCRGERTYAQSSESFDLLRIAKKTSQQENAVDNAADKAFTADILKEFGRKWDSNNFNFAKMLKDSMPNDEVGIVLGTLEAEAIADAVVAAAKVKALATVGEQVSNGVDKAAELFRNSFGKNNVDIMIENALLKSPEDWAFKEFKSAFEKLPAVA